MRSGETDVARKKQHSTTRRVFMSIPTFRSSIAWCVNVKPSLLDWLWNYRSGKWLKIGRSSRLKTWESIREMIAHPAKIPPLPDRQPEYSNVNKVCNIPFQTNTEQIQQAAHLPSPCKIWHHVSALQHTPGLKFWSGRQSFQEKKLGVLRKTMAQEQYWGHKNQTKRLGP